MKYEYETKKCDVCGRFMKMEENAVSWAPFGGPSDMDPPEREFCHLGCWCGLSEADKNLVRTTSWQKPSTLYEVV